MSFDMLISLLGGLGMFLFGMRLMGDGLEKAAGSRMRSLLEVLTKNRVMAMLVGAAFTAIIQSSSATTVMVVGFVNAGLMNLMQATGIIFGANIGTTVTGLLIALKVETFTPILLIVGAVMVLFMRNTTAQRIGQVLVGFGILFQGMMFMSSAMKPLRTDENFISFMSSFDNPMMAVLVGAVFTGVIQSSSAAVGIVQVMAGQGLMPLPTAIFIMLGTNIGTCVTALLSSIGTSNTAKRAAVIHLLFNVMGSGIFLILINFFPLVDWLHALTSRIVSPADEAVFARQFVADGHILFNVISTLCFLPFGSVLVKIATWIIPGQDPQREACRLQYLDQRILSTPPIVVGQVSKEIERMGRLAVDNLELSMEAFFEGKKELYEEVENNEQVINYLNHEITLFLVKCGQLELPPWDIERIGSFYHVINDLERIGDHAENMAEYAVERVSEELTFTEAGIGELRHMLEKTIELCNLSLSVLHNRDKSQYPRVRHLEGEIDDLEKMYQQAHVDRLQQGLCSARSGMIFSDMLSNLERVADHATNIAFSAEDITT